MTRHVRRLGTIVAGLGLVASSTAMAPAAAVDKSDNVRHVANFAYTGGTDIAFSGKYAYAGQLGNEGGVHVFDVSKKRPQRVTFISCPGSQNDVAVVKRGLLALGYHNGQCGAAPGAGVRLIDVRNPKRPRFLGQVELPGGTHTLTVYPGKPIIYASPGGLANGGGVQQILDASDPKDLKVAAEFKPNQAGCHDLTFHFNKDRKLAFCAGLTETQIWDVADPLEPLILGRIVNPAMFFPHSAVATPDGDYLVVGDEAFGVHECVAGGPLGSLYVYDITNPELPLLVGQYGPTRGAAPVGTAANDWCTAHNFNFVPGTRTMVMSWYTGGTTVIDFSDPTFPVEIAHFVPDDADTWSSYWYRNRIYTNDLNRGFDVVEVKGLKEKR